jgi:hypothetical protein
MLVAILRMERGFGLNFVLRLCGQEIGHLINLRQHSFPYQYILHWLFYTCSTPSFTEGSVPER